MKIQSSAFPTQKAPNIHSKAHQMIQWHLRSYALGDVVIRDYQDSDLQELKNLQKQWFPLNYSDDFYKKIQNKIATCFIAQTEVQVLVSETQIHPKKVIVGAVVFEITSETQDIESNWLNRIFAEEENAIYVMTLGVVDELRSTGLAKRLLQKLINYAQSLPKIGLVLLHVVSYNRRAIKFYKKNGFSMLEYITDHYHIMGKEYDGLKLGIFVNEGKRRQKWGQWFKRVIFRMEVIDQWPV